MCGITGYLHFDSSRNADEKLVRKMTDTLSHRGPDGEGYFFRNNVGLGHRRLSIIDLSANGKQPMLNTNQSHWIVYNGEIYVGGIFSNAGGVPANNIAKWNGTSWSAVGTGTNDAVNDFAIFNGELYVVGGFTTAGGISANRIAKWDGTINS